MLFRPLEQTRQDGRNRREACKLAGVVPRTRELDGEDPTAFILSANVHRRNLTTGRFMAVAMLAPEPPEASESGKKGGRGKKGPASGSLSVSSQRIVEAREVLKYP